MMKNKEKRGYNIVPPDEYWTPSNEELKSLSSPRSIFVLACIALQLINVVLIIVGYVWLTSEYATVPDIDGREFPMQANEDYQLIQSFQVSRLNAYNTSKGFVDYDVEVVSNVDNVTDQFWRSYPPDSGVISLDKVIAKQMKLPASIESPTDPSKTLYQVEVGHSVHCLNMIRKGVFDEGPFEHPEMRKKHLSHCIGYLRQVLMCHSDLEIVPVSFERGHVIMAEQYLRTGTCKDPAAIKQWVGDHRWAELWKPGEKPPTTHNQTLE